MLPSSLRNRISDEKVDKAIEKLNANDNLRVDGAQYVLIREDRYDDMLNLYRDHFFPDEPISKGVDLTMDDELRDFMRKPLLQNLSIALVSSQTGELIGGRIIKVNNRQENKLSISTFKSEAMKKFAYISTEADKRCNIFDHHNVEEVFHFYGIAVRRNFRQRGIGYKLMRAAVLFIRSLGLGTVVIKGGGTSLYSQRLFEKTGFEKLSEVVYSEFKMNGEIVVQNTGVNKSEIRYGLCLS